MNVRKINEDAAGDGRVVEFAAHRPTVGEWLRDARESYGLKLGDVSSTLRIRQTYLEAIEADRFEDLPGATYAIGFLRAYSEYLGLDGVAVVQRFREQAGEDHGEEELSFPVPRSDNRVPRGAILLMSLALAVIAYGAWYMLQDEETAVVTEAAAPPPVETARSAPSEPSVAESPRVPAPSSIAAQAKQEDAVETPATAPAANEGAQVAPTAPLSEADGDEAAAAAPTATGTAADEPAAPAAAEAAAESARDTAADPAASATAEDAATTAPGASETVASDAPAREVPAEPVPKPDTQAAANEPAEPVQTASAPPAPPAAPDPTATVAPGEIVIRAQVDSWVEVRDADNAPLVSRLLRAGDEYEIPAGQGLQLVTGNASALSVFVDGDEVPPLAPPGAVRRYIALDAERLRQGNALIE